MVVHETYMRTGTESRPEWLLPTEVRLEGEGGARKAVEIATGQPAVIGSVEKMSKSKKNLVDPDDIIGHYGADCARWFMLSDSPPERDVQWTEAGVEGAGRLVQRIWRLTDDATGRMAGRGTAQPATLEGAALDLHRATHKTLDAVGRSIEALRFNVAVAQIYELTNVFQSTLSKAGGTPQPDLAWSLREANEVLVQLIGPMMPHLGEECWARLGYNTLLADQPWPQVDAGMLVDDTIVIAVQVNGKRRDELRITRDADPAAVEAAALQLEGVQRALAGKAARKVIVVPQRIVNVVV